MQAGELVYKDVCVSQETAAERSEGSKQEQPDNFTGISKDNKQQ